MSSDLSAGGDPYEEALRLSDQEEPDIQLVHRLLQSAQRNGDLRAKYALATWFLHGEEGVAEVDHRSGVAILRELENSNIAEAIFDLAVSYDHGWGVRRNEQRAFSLYMRAALLGNAESCKQIAEFYREGKAVKRDLALSRSWAMRGSEPESKISPPYRLWLRPPHRSTHP